MSAKASTGLRNGMLDSGSLKSQLDAGFIKLYNGTVPATADAAIGGATLLCTLSINSTGVGINFDTTATGDVLSKAPGEIWSGTNAASGTATFYRHVAAADDGTLSTTSPRLQGTIAVAGADMNLSSVALVNGATQTLAYYSVTIPTF